jgi:hypothetical protein
VDDYDTRLTEKVFSDSTNNVCVYEYTNLC